MWERGAHCSCSHNPPACRSGCARGGIDPRRAQLGGVRREPGTPALGVEARPIVAVSMDELRVFTCSAEDPGRARPLRLLAGCLHPGTVSHLGELAHRSNGHAARSKVHIAWGPNARFATRGCIGPRCTVHPEGGPGMRGKLGLALGVGAASALVLVVSLVSVSVAGPNVSRLAVSSMRPPTPSSISPRTAIRPVICSRSTTSCSTPGTRTWWGRIRGSAFGSRWA